MSKPTDQQSPSEPVSRRTLEKYRKDSITFDLVCIALLLFLGVSCFVLYISNNILKESLLNQTKILSNVVSNQGKILKEISLARDEIQQYMIKASSTPFNKAECFIQ